MSRLDDFIKESIIAEYCDTCDVSIDVELGESHIGGDKFHTWLDEIVVLYIEELDEYEIIELIVDNLLKRGDRVKENLFTEMTRMYAVKNKLADYAIHQDTSP